MNFGFNDEQELLRSTARKFFDNECPSTTVRALMEDSSGMTPELWKKLAEQGWLGLIAPEEHGGMALGIVDLVVLLEEMGRAVVPGPFFSTVLLGAAGITLQAAAKGSGFTLSGTKLFVHDAHTADVIVVAARTASGQNPEEGISLFLVPTGTPGLTVTLLPTMDQTRKLCEVTLTNVSLAGDALMGAPGAGWKPLARVIDRATVGLCAEMCGGAQKVLDMTVEYAKIRQAFGRPIGSYQGVKHRAADMLVDVENSKSITYYAAWAMDEGVPEGPLAVSMAKAYVSDAYRRVSGAGIQLHGGIGFTWEHDLHLYFKRAKGSEFTFGDATWHRERVAQLVNL